MSCPACEQARQEGKRFCNKCGAQLRALTPEEERRLPYAARHDVPKAKAPSQWKEGMPEPPEEMTARETDSAPEKIVQRPRPRDVPATEPAVSPAPVPEAAAPTPAPAAEAASKPEKKASKSEKKTPKPEKKASKPEKKKSARGRVIAIAALAALAIAVGALFGSGAISFGGKTGSKAADGPVYEPPVKNGEKKAADEPSGGSADASADADGTYTVMDSDGASVVYTGAAETDDAWTFAFDIENQTNDPIQIIIRSETINGRQLECSVGRSETDLAGDESRSVDISISKEALAAFRIKKIDALMVGVWLKAEGETKRFSLAEFAPDGSDPGKYKLGERMSFAREQLIVNEPDLKVMVGEPHVSGSGDFVLLLYYKNQRSSTVQIDLDSPVSSGQALTGVSGTYAIAETEGYNWLVIPSDSLQAAGLNAAKIRKLTFRVAVTEEGADAAFIDQTVEYTVSDY